MVYENTHWISKTYVDSHTDEEIGKAIQERCFIDYGNGYEYEIERTGETRTRAIKP